jgi:AbrB family looped-hinge helix DNA binding protein
MANSEKAELTILSEKGQVVIPAKIRSKMGLKPKTKFLVYDYQDAVILKKYAEPDLSEQLQEMYKRIDQKIAKYGELTQDDIEAVIQKYRKEKAAKHKKK